MPTRVRWDVDFHGRAGRTKRIARQIREASPRIVELRIEGEKGISELPAIFTEIQKGNPRVEATVRIFPGATSVSQRGYAMEFIWQVDAHAPFRGLLLPGPGAVSVTIDGDTLPRLPDVLEEFADSDLRTLHLPNVNAVRALAEVGHVPVPRPGHLQEAAEIISRLSLSLEGKRLVVHDPSLWRLLRDAFPDEAGGQIEFSGCRGGSALAYVDWEGNLYPCDSLPIRLGNLQETTFERIWRAPARVRVLDAIRAMPASCDPRDQMKGIRSTCRDLANLPTESIQSKGPGCTGR
jgi:radical SAM protein with 4Fe4S-binding SPASM domain